MMDDQNLRQQMERITELVQRLDASADASVREQSRDLLQAVMDWHREALERMIQGLRGTGDGDKTLTGLASDPVVASVLLLYGLHPVNFETRVHQVLEKLRPILRNHGAEAELVSLDSAVVQVRVSGVENAFTSRRVKAAIEEEMYAAAPDAASLALLGLERFASPDFVPLERLGATAARKAGDCA